MRTTSKQIEAFFEFHLEHLLRDAGYTGRLAIDHAPHYGGYCIEEDGQPIGGRMMDANRMPAGQFYQAMRILEDVLRRKYVE